MFDRYIRHTHTHTNTKASQQFFFIGSILIGEEQKLDSIHYIMCIQVENLKLHGNSGKKEIFREGCLSWHGYFFFALFCCVYNSVCVRFFQMRACKYREKTIWSTMCGCVKQYSQLVFTWRMSTIELDSNPPKLPQHAFGQISSGNH